MNFEEMYARLADEAARQGKFERAEVLPYSMLPESQRTMFESVSLDVFSQYREGGE
jgi:hypothetical protein